MPIYVFTKIVDNDNPDDFAIDVSQMTDFRLRMSALRTQCLRHHYYNIGKWRPVYRYFYKDYSFYPIHKQEFPNLAEARKHKVNIHNECTARRQKNKVTTDIRLEKEFKEMPLI